MFKVIRSNTEITSLRSDVTEFDYGITSILQMIKVKGQGHRVKCQGNSVIHIHIARVIIYKLYKSMDQLSLA